MADQNQKTYSIVNCCFLRTLWRMLYNGQTMLTLLKIWFQCQFSWDLVSSMILFLLLCFTHVLNSYCFYIQIISLLKYVFWFCFSLFDLFYYAQRHFQLYHGASFSGGRSRSTQREPPTMGKQLVNIITCRCE